VPRQLRTLAQVVEERPCTTERWLRRCISERRFAFYKARGRVFIDLVELDAYLESCRVEPPRPSRLRAVR
jgi:hypothetical protein